MRAVLADGRLCPDGKVAIDADDPGLTLGLCAFETLRTYGRRPFRLARHLARLAASAEALRVPWPGAEPLADEIERAIEGVPGQECNVRVTLTAGGARVVRAETLVTAQGGARCATAVWEPPPWLPGWTKHTSRAGSALVIPQGASEVIWVDRAGLLLEGTRSNVIAVRGEVLLTPPLDGRILAGVTREVLLEVARGQGIPVLEAPLPAAGPFDELYLCSTLRELQPVFELDGQSAPGAGPVGEAVLAAFRAALPSLLEGAPQAS